MKTILYLDQNYVSYLAKARLGVKVNLAAYYENLYDALREAVHDNAVVCPASTFHTDESSLDTRLAPELYRTLTELSYGTELLFWGHILQAQGEAALHRYLGLQPPPTKPAWKEAFNKDPHGDFEASPPAMHISTAEAFVDVHRRAKDLHQREGKPAPVAHLAAQKRAEASRIVYDFYIRPWDNLLQGNVGYLALAGWRALPRLWEVYCRLTERKVASPAPRQLLEFLHSDEIANAPFIDIWSVLRAAMLIQDQERRPKGSDLQDVFIAAAVLPYCDVFATDGHMKHLIVALKLDKQYNVRVLGSRKADILTLTSLVRELSSGEPPVSPPLTPPA